MSKKPVTKALHTKIPIGDSHPVVTPLFQNSAFEASSPHFYTRMENPNSLEMEKVISVLEGAEYCLSTTTGMTAINMCFVLISPGSTVVLNSFTYGCSCKLLERLKNRFNYNLIILDLSEEKNIEKIPRDCAMVFFETPTNPFLKSVHIQKVSHKLKAMNPSGIVVVDNTWATPLFQKPLVHGADISLYSATKFFSGHSDVMGGFITTNDAEKYKLLKDERFYTGSILDPHSAWLLRRSIQTFELRMKEHVRGTEIMAEYLSSQPKVKKLYLPHIDGEQLENYGGILFFELSDDVSDKYETFRDNLEIFDSGTGMACVTSMVAQPYTGSHASLENSEKENMGIQKSLVRLCFGMEDLEDLKNDLSRAFSKL